MNVKYKKIDKILMDVSSVVMSIVAVTIGVVLIGSLLIPSVVDTIADLPDGHEDWGNLLSIVVICSIIGLIAVALYAFKSKS